MNKIVSVLICSFNASDTIGNTLSSVLNQTYKNIEVLILDNNSKDNTVELIKSFNDKRIKLFKSKKNLGPYGGLNYLLERAKGKYIAIQDHDDLRCSHKLEKQIDILENNPQYIGSGTGQIEYYSKQRKGIITNLKGGKTNFVPHTSLLFRNGKYRYDKKNDFLGDAFFELKILTKGKKNLYSIPEVLLLHYNKESGTNYSDQRFSLNKANYKRFFSIYKNNLRIIIIYLLFFFFYVIGGVKLKNKVNKIILGYIHKELTFDELLRYDENTKELMQYYL